MRLDPPPARTERRENIVPMVNVVFLLLIFFLLAAQIAPPEPIEVAVPTAAGEAHAERQTALYVTSESELAFGDYRGTAALDALEKWLAAEEAGLLEVRADGRADGAAIAALMAELAERHT